MERTTQTRETARLLKQAGLLIPRLERLTPDSGWSFRASGCRRSLLRLANQLETDPTSAYSQEQGSRALRHALHEGFKILHAAARERY